MIIWTRSQKDWEQDQSLFSDLNKIIHLPCIRKNHLDFSSKPSHQSLIICTSSYCAQLLPKVDNPVVCFGKKTKSILENRGFTTMYFSVATAQELIPFIVPLQPQYPHLWLPGPVDRAFYFDKFATQANWDFESVDLYYTELGPFAKEGILNSIDNIDKATICFASPSSVHAFVKVMDFKPNWSAISIGKTTSRALCKYSISPITIQHSSIISLIKSAEDHIKTYSKDSI